MNKKLNVCGFDEVTKNQEQTILSLCGAGTMKSPNHLTVMLNWGQQKEQEGKTAMIQQDEREQKR